ncbi:hypothetical protein ACQ4PT_065432 [Festuca glaucescens]
MQATGDLAADDAGSGGSRDGDQRIQVNHGGFFCGVGRNRTYLDTKVDLFDELSQWSFSCSHLDYILKELGYNTGDRSLRVYWCKPGCTVGDGLVAIKWEKDAYLMKTCAAEEKNLTVYVDHVNLLEKQRCDDVVLEPVALPAVISPSKHVKKRRMEDDEQTKNAAKGKAHMSAEEELADDLEANFDAESLDDEKAFVLSCCSANSSDLDSDFVDSDYEFDEDDDQFKKHVDEDVTDALVAKASLKFVSLPEQDIREEEELELPEEMNGGLTYKWKTFNKMTDMHNPTFKVGMVLSDVKELRATIAMYCVRNRRQLKKKRNNSIRVEVGCRPKCNWKMIATKQTRKDGSFVVTKLFDKHECERVWEVKELTVPMIAEEYLDEIRDNENLSLKSFAKKVQKKCNMRPNRFKLARAKLACLKKIRGDEIAHWKWFLTTLKQDLNIMNTSPFTIMSDKQKGLIKFVMELFPDSEHRFCVGHLYNNMNQLHKGEVVKNHLWTCARASSPARWEECMEAFKTECPAAHAWLDEMPPNTWARAFFSEFPKCDLLLNNTCEVFNKPLRDHSEWAKTNGPHVQPPLYEKKVGRPNKNRRKNPEEIEGGTRLSRAGVTEHCGYCKEPGHNRTGCPRLNAIREAEAAEQARREAEENVDVPNTPEHIDHVYLDKQFGPSELDDSMINQLNQEVPTIIFDEEEPFPEESAFVASYRESIPASRAPFTTATSDGMAVLRGGRVSKTAPCVQFSFFS